MNLVGWFIWMYDDARTYKTYLKKKKIGVFEPNVSKFSRI